MGEGPIDRDTGLPSKQPTTAERQHLPAPPGSLNSVMSVAQRRFGAAAEKSWVPSARSGRFGGAGAGSPA